MGLRGTKARKKPLPVPHQPESPWPGFALPSDFDAEAAREFQRLSVVLVKFGVAGKVDPRLVVAAARTHSLIEKAHTELAEGQGKLTQSAANGTLMPHPMLAVLNTQTMRLKTLWAEMGLTPASSKITTPVEETRPVDGWGDLLNVVG